MEIYCKNSGNINIDAECGFKGDISYEELTAFALENQYTRYPVYEENIDKILGFIHVKDLYSISLKQEEFTVEKLLRPILLVPETMTLDNLIIEFKKSHGQMAVVVDEFGGTSGLITLEDVLEEIILITLCVTHLSEDLTVLADDTLDRIV